MSKKIAVLVRDRQKEALRMALGVMLMDDLVDVYVLDRKVEDNEDNIMNIDTLKSMDISIYTNCRENTDLVYLQTEEIGEKILLYDTVLPY
jgi:hypothetical protein